MEKNIAALLDTSAYTVTVMFKQATNTPPKECTYICNIPGVKPGDWVVVDAPDGDDYMKAYGGGRQMVDIEDAIDTAAVVFMGMPKTVIVTQVDTEVTIEPNSPTTFKWVVARVDLTAYKKTMQRNSQVTTLVADAYKKSMRKSFAERILGDLETAAQLRLSNLLNAPKPAAKRTRKQG